MQLNMNELQKIKDSRVSALITDGQSLNHSSALPK
jgi:hypothetical protein